MVVYINTRTATLEEVNKLLQDIAEGKLTATAHETKAGALAFDTHEGDK